jgi:hypothetical protein
MSAEIATARQLGEVQELMLRTVVRNGVTVKRTGIDDIGTDLDEADTFWQNSWVARGELKRGVYQRRENDVTKASNRVSVSRATHALVERELLDAKYAATAVVEDGVKKLAHPGNPSSVDQHGKTPTYTYVRLSNKGERLVKKLRSSERNTWQPEVRGGGI